MQKFVHVCDEPDCGQVAQHTCQICHKDVCVKHAVFTVGMETDLLIWNDGTTKTEAVLISGQLLVCSICRGHILTHVDELRAAIEVAHNVAIQQTREAIRALLAAIALQK